MTPSENSIPYGYCHCGCGGKTTVATKNCLTLGYTKGVARKWIIGHQNRAHPVLETAMPFKVDGFPCRIIPLTLGVFTIVLDAHYEWLMQWKWHAKLCKKTGSLYASRNLRTDELPTNRHHVALAMHRLILGLDPDDKRRADHINGNTLLNIPSNLRPATYSQNCTNQTTRRDNTSGRKGVYLRSGNGKWRVIIALNGRNISLGDYTEYEKACAVREAAEIKYHGDYVRK